MSIDHPTTQTSVAINTYGGTGPLRVLLNVPGSGMRGDFLTLPIRDLPALVADLQAVVAVREAYPDAITITPQQAADAAAVARGRAVHEIAEQLLAAGFNTNAPEN